MADDATPMTPEEGAPSVPVAPPAAPTLPDATPVPSAVAPILNVPLSMVDATLGNPAASSPLPAAISVPPSADHHLSWIGRVLDRVGSLLGGDETYRLKKQPDGSVEISQDPSTRGEKWGRIAAAALGGAAQGLANSQGPGGLARAGAAGVQYGMQRPQQQRQDLQQQVNFENQQLLAKANRIHLTQQAYLTAQQAKLVGAEFDKLSADNLANWENTLTNSPNAQDLGALDPSDPNAALNLAKTNPAAYDAFLQKGNHILRAVYAPDHKLHLVMTDRSWEERRNTVPMELLHIGKDSDGNAAAVTETVPVNGAPVQKINDNNMAVQLVLATLKKNAALTRKADAEAEAAPGKVDQTARLTDARIGQLNASANRSNAQAAAANRLAAGQPGGAPDATGTFDPEFPPPQNFPAGTQGIAHPDKSGNFKVPAKVQDRASLSRNILENTSAVIPLIQANPQILGAGGGRFSTVAQMIGDADPAIQRLGTRIHNIAMATVGIHGSRAVGNVHDVEAGLLNKYKTSPQALIQALQDNMDSAQTFIREEKNYQTYGTATGPDRSLARAPGAQTTQPATPPPQPQQNAVRPAPVQPPRGPNVPPGYIFGDGPRGAGWYPPAQGGGQ